MCNFIIDFFKKIKFDFKSDRIGPDCPFTHWKLYFLTLSQKLCQKKFYHFGDNSVVRPGALIAGCSRVSIGNNVTIRPTSMLFAASDNISIEIEDDVLIGNGVHIYTSNHEFLMADEPIINQGFRKPKKVTLKKGCWIGANTIILPGVTIGENSVIGAGSIVTKSIPPFVVAVGNPCNIIKQIKS